MVEVGNEGLLLNRMWNMKVEQAQRKIVELQALFQYLGLESIEVKEEEWGIGEEFAMDTVLKALFVQVVGCMKAMGGGE